MEKIVGTFGHSGGRHLDDHTEHSIRYPFPPYIDGKENAKMTGDRMKMLMLTLPFMVRDLIAPEVPSALDILCIPMYIFGITQYILLFSKPT